MATYSMQSAKIPRGICDEIDKKSRRFLWGSTEEEKKTHLISWDTITKPKEQGGLGLHSMRQSNAAFLAKLGWRALTEPRSLWSRVLKNKYCNGRCDLDMFKPHSYSSNLWKGITENAHLLRQGCQVSVGNGKSTLFWQHNWIIDQTLIENAIKEVPYSLRGVLVANMWDSVTGWKWDSFGEFLPISILKRIQAFRVIPDVDCEDSLFWNKSTNGCFTIKSAIALMHEPDDEEEHPN